MFYFKELLLRFKFIIISSILIFILCYIYKDLLLIVFSFSLLKLPLNSFNDFIYTHHIELFKVHFYFAFLICTYYILPFFLWHCLDFLRSSLTRYNYTMLFKQILLIILVLFTFIVAKLVNWIFQH